GLVETPEPITALVPIKETSERVPGKNLRLLCGRPLLHWLLDALHRSRRVGRVVVDTDSDEIERTVLELHPSTIVLRRPERLHGNQVNGNDLIEWELSQVDGERFGQFHVTSPLLTPATIDQTVDTWAASDNDSLFTVTEHHFWLFDEHGTPLNSDTSTLVRSQDLAPIFEDNNAIHLFTRRSFTARRSRIGVSPLMHPIPKIDATDIDWPDDFEIAEALMARRLNR